MIMAWTTHTSIGEMEGFESWASWQKQAGLWGSLTMDRVGCVSTES